MSFIFIFIFNRKDSLNLCTQTISVLTLIFVFNANLVKFHYVIELSWLVIFFFFLVEIYGLGFHWWILFISCKKIIKFYVILTYTTLFKFLLYFIESKKKTTCSYNWDWSDFILVSDVRFRVFHFYFNFSNLWNWKEMLRERKKK